MIGFTGNGLMTALGVLLVSFGCASSGEEPPGEIWQTQDSTYVFTEPDAEFELPAELAEISGLTFMEDGLLGAVQDEDGDLFIIDPSSGEVLDVRTFGEGGDYEGIERTSARLYILRSDGRIYSFTNWTGRELESETIDLDLPRGCDAEGIAVQHSLNRMLVACKENAGDGLTGHKAIFSFNLARHVLDASPAYVMNVKDFEQNIDDHPLNEAVRSMLSDRLDMSGFKPSALAVHPRTGDVYVASTVTRAVVRLSESGSVTSLWKLPGKLFAQPEGIAFDSNGNLYISNEAGGKKRGNLLKFRERRAPSAAPPDTTQQ